MEKIATIASDFQAGNTDPPGNPKRKYSDIENITNITTEEGSPAFHWVFTWHNFPDNWKQLFQDRKNFIDKICVGEEVCPTTGRKHLQGWLRLVKKNIAKRHLRLPVQIHWEAMSRNATERQNTIYCTKSNTNILSWNVELPYTVEINITAWMIEMMKIIDTKPDIRSIYWIWDEGNSGKSLFTKKMMMEGERTILINGKGHDIRHCVADMITETGNFPRTVIMDVPRVNKDYISYEALENVKNMAFYSGKFKGKQVCGPNPHVIVFANKQPEYDKMTQDRWKVARIVNDVLVWE